MAILLAVLALPACADAALIQSSGDTGQLMRGCATRPPVGACSPAAGAIVVRYRWRF